MKRTRTPTSEYGAFQAQIAATPYDAGAWQQFIDWLLDQDRQQEACVARIALEQRVKFGPLTAADFVHDGKFDQQQLISRFSYYNRRRLATGRIQPYPERDYLREARFRSRCKFETRVNPRSKLPEYRVVGPDPQVHPLDCPPMDERRRRTAWAPYPDEWFVLWACTASSFTEEVLWNPIMRALKMNEQRYATEAIDTREAGIIGTAVRDQDGRCCYRRPHDLKLPEDAFGDS